MPVNTLLNIVVSSRRGVGVVPNFLSGPTTTQRLKALNANIFPFLCDLKFIWSSWHVSAWFHTLHCCHMDNSWINKGTSVSVKGANECLLKQLYFILMLRPILKLNLMFLSHFKLAQIWGRFFLFWAVCTICQNYYKLITQAVHKQTFSLYAC